MATLTVPESLREELKRPLGKLYPSLEPLLADLRARRPPKLISVGDVVTYSLLKANVLPDLSVIDGKAMREAYTPDRKYRVPQKEVRLSNPAGQITDELRAAVKQAVFDIRTRIYIVGEEDLAVLPAIEYAPRGTAVLYGQPREGVVWVPVDEAMKQRVQDLYGRMART